MILSSCAASAALADTLLLEPPTPAYPVLLDHSCGGVHTSTYVVGFDASGNVAGVVYAWTRCDAGGGRSRRTKTYASWHSLVWDLNGSLLTMTASGAATPDPSFTATDKRGNTISTRRLGSSASSADFVGVLTTH